MIIDTDRHVTVESYEDLFPHMSLSWRKHFERGEWLESVAVAVSRVADQTEEGEVARALESAGAPVVTVSDAV